MAGALHGVLASLKAAAGAATDTFFRYVSLLLNTTSTNGAQNNTFLDSSTNAFSITRNGNTTQGTFSPFSQTGWSNYFDGTGDYLSVADNTAFDFGSGDFTLECFVFANSGAGALFSKRATSGDFAPFNAGVFTNAPVFLVSTTGLGWAFNITSTVTIVPNTWNHIAFTRNGTTGTIWVNGVSGGTGTVTGALMTNATAVTVGAGAANGDFSFNGHISNARVVKGTAVYTSNFTPPTSPLTAITNTSLLTCQSNRFIDNSSNAFAITRNGDVSVQAFSPFNPTAAWSASTNGGSGYFDGTGDYLTVPNDNVFDTNSTFTLECWFYLNASGDAVFFGRGGGVSSWSTSDGHQFLLFIESNNLYWMWNNSGVTAQIQTTKPAINQWNHVAVGYNGTTTRFWLNGASLGSSATGYTLPTTRNIIYVSANPATGSANINGYISNLRFVKGTDVYGVGNTTIPVPTAPLTAITNTSLLLNFTNAGIYDSASGNDLETVGNAQVSTVQAKWGTTSLAFDGTGDWLVVPASPRWDFGSGDFTVEMWLNPSSTTTTDAVISKGNVSSTGNEVWTLQWFGTNQLAFFSGGGLVSPVVNTTTQFSTGTWYHVAVTRSGTTTRIFVNGTQEASSTTSYTVTAGGSLYVGAGWFAPASRDTSGYIDDLRITNGVARYTANFTAPTAAFPLQ